MARRHVIPEIWRYRVNGWRYGLALAGLALMVPLSVAMMLWLMPASQAADNWQVEGSNGVLHISGALAESACRLEMASARQDVWLGEVATGRLEQVGARGVPVAFELRLRDCLRSRAASRDERTGILSWAPDQPAVRVSFSSRAVRDNPQLVKAQGVGGIGLRMLDEHGRNVRLGSRGEPLWLTPGSNVLAYRVMAERTAQPLVPGSYHAVVDFHLSYD
ncbi:MULTISPECIES: fimbrial protein [Serratia]|uniref:fimbrial protein n=1 Tax=Serratia TaxID=613 RepID=UPI003557DE2D